MEHRVSKTSALDPWIQSLDVVTLCRTSSFSSHSKCTVLDDWSRQDPASKDIMHKDQLRGGFADSHVFHQQNKRGSDSGRTNQTRTLCIWTMAS